MKKFTVVLMVLALVLIMSSIASAEISWGGISWDDSIKTAMQKIDKKGFIESGFPSKLIVDLDGVPQPFPMKAMIPMLVDKPRFNKFRKIYVPRAIVDKKGNFAKTKLVEFSGKNGNMIDEGKLYFSYNTEDLMVISISLRDPDKDGFVKGMTKKYGKPVVKGITYKWSTPSNTLYFTYRNKQQNWVVYVDEIALKKHLKNIDLTIAMSQEEKKAESSRAAGNF